MATDTSGTTYTSNTGKPATYGTPVTIPTPNGPVQGTMRGGYVVKDS